MKHMRIVLAIARSTQQLAGTALQQPAASTATATEPQPSRVQPLARVALHAAAPAPLSSSSNRLSRLSKP